MNRPFLAVGVQRLLVMIDDQFRSTGRLRRAHASERQRMDCDDGGVEEAEAVWKPETWVALGSAAVALLAAIVVPLSSYLYSVRQQKRAWARQHRVELYAEILAEAVAERQFFQLAVHPHPQEASQLPSLTDTRRPPSERRALGVRVMVGASEAVGNAFMVHSNVTGQAVIERVWKGEVQVQVAEAVIMEKFDALQATMRAELGTDKIKP